MQRSLGNALGTTMGCFVAGIVLLMAVPVLSQTNNCCSVDRQCATGDDWVNGYYAYQNNQCVATVDSQQQQSSSSQSQPQPTPVASEDIDNCCFVDRECSTDEEWVNGYNAYQNDQCAAPSQQQQTQARQTQQTPSQINNCCFSGWQCNTDEEWTSGYWAFQNVHCAIQSHWEEQWRRQQNGNQQQSSSVNPNPVKRTYDPYTRTTVFEYEDGSEIIVRPPTNEELCEALERLELPLPPECEDN